MSSNGTPKAEDAAALERVRARVVNTPDAKLPSILHKLLPRLVSRFPPSTTAAAAAGVPRSSSVESATGNDNVSVDPNLAGIFEHILERVLLNQHLLLAGSSTEWVESLLESIVPTSTTGTGWTHYKYVLPILEVALARCNVPGALAKLMIILEDVQSQALAVLPPAAAETGTDDDEDVTMEDNASDENDTAESATTMVTKDTSLRNVWDRASWMVLEQIAKQSNVLPILDWNFIGDHWDDWNAPTNYKKIKDYMPTQEECNAIININNNPHTENTQDAVYSLFLDFFTFDPTTPSNVPSTQRWQFRRQTESIQDDYDQVHRQQVAAQQAMRAADEATTTMLLNQRGRRRRDPTSWNEAEVHYWRALQRCLQPYAVQLFSSSNASSQQHHEHNTMNRDREDILRILTGQRKPVAKLGYRPKASKMYKVNDRIRAQRIQEQERKQVCRHSLAVGSALLHLLLGGARAQQIMDKNWNSKTESITQWQPEPRHYALVGSHPWQKACPPLSNTMAQRVFAYLLTAELDLDLDRNPNSDTSGRDLEIFMDLMNQLKTVPSLNVSISAEIYELIGAQTPGPICWAVHFLWKVSSKVSDGSSTSQSVPLHSLLSKRAWDAATELLDRLQDIQVHRFQRERRLAMIQGSNYQRIHENREKQALKSRFVVEALQARSEAYQLLTKFVTEKKILASSASQSNRKKGSREFSWDLCIRLLNCAAFDLSKETLPALQEACISVLSVYRQAMENDMDEAFQKVPINPLLLPLLKACISSSDWSREFVLQWAEDILIHVDPGLSRVILECLAGDEVSLIAGRAREAFRRLSAEVFNKKNDSLSPSCEATVISFWDLTQPVHKDAVRSDLQRRITALTQKHDGLSTVAAQLILQEFDFSVQAAHTALEEDWDSTLSRCGCAQTQQDVVDMDMDQDSKEGRDDLVCEVCFEDIPQGGGFALSCNHRFCVPCWQEGIEAAVGASSKELVIFSCLQHDCNLRITQETMAQVAPSMISKHEDATLECFLLSSPDYKFCPGADCTAVALCCNIPSAKGPQEQATCKLCATAFCFGCGNDPHSPVDCETRLKFKAMADRLDAHAESVENKTIECPNCRIGITKNGGCNHMTCTRCGHEFCWICLSADWQDHVCNVFDSLNGVDNVERLQFFSRRVTTHQESAQAARQLLDNFDNHANDLQYHARCCDQEHLQILKASWKTLAAGRDYLANSYIAAYGMSEMDPSVQREFQTHQSQLQLFVEQLSLLCDHVPNLYKIANNEKEFRVRFKGVRFCAVAVSGYIQRVDSFMRRHVE